MTPEDQKKLAEADPVLAAAFVAVEPLFAAEFPGSTLGVANTYRPPIVQAVAAASGASPFDGVTTFSTHQVFPSQGLDFIVRDPTVPGGWVMNGKDSRYGWAGNAFEEQGLVWGGMWRSPDYDHVQKKVPNPTAEQVADSFQKYEDFEAAQA